MSERKGSLYWGWNDPREGDMVTYLGVHVVQWSDKPERPSMAFTPVTIFLTGEERVAIYEIIERAEQREREAMESD